MIYLPSEDTWYITRDINAEEGDIRSEVKEAPFVPGLGWTFYDHGYFENNDFSNCKTIRLRILII